MPRVFVAGLFHETHTFLEETTSLSDFEIRTGPPLFECRGDSSPLGGVLEFFAQVHWDVIPGPDYRALPGGTVQSEVIRRFWTDLQTSWEQVDAIFLVLHGAMVSEEHLDVEGELLRRLRGLPNAASLPLFAVYDLHANISATSCRYADGLYAYRKNPHSDARSAAIRAARDLERSWTSESIPVVLHRSAGLIWAPAHTGTAEDPMRSLEARARELEETDPAIWAVNVSAGFAYADTPDTGVSFQIVTTSPSEAEPHLESLVQTAQGLQAHLPPGDEPVETVLNRLIEEPCDGLTVLVEPSDNIGAGAPGDATGLLRALVAKRIPEAAICLQDPEAVSQCRPHRSGERFELSLGGKGSRFDPGPLSLNVELVSQSDGSFTLEDPQSHLASMSGDRFDMGPCAVVRREGLQILLTSRRTPPFDLGQWRSQGIDPAALKVIVVKAAVAHRQAYDPITARSFRVDTPGPCRTDLSHFSYRWASP